MTEWKRGIPEVSGVYWTRLSFANGPAGTFLVRLVRDAAYPEHDCVEFFGTENASYLDEDRDWFADREFYGPVEVPTC